MYKTVRHGDNSLQYKILAQQEEGTANVKCRKSRGAVTAKFVTVVVLLVCGVIASAVLVPMILTDDFVTLTGTFQKFSVSTLRRSHSGNHVVVMAKKPYGWNASRPGVAQASKSSDASRNHSLDTLPKKVGDSKTTAYPGTIRATSSSDQDLRRTTPRQPASDGNESPIASEEQERLPKSQPAASVVQEQKSFRAQAASEDVSSTPRPLWRGGRHKWDLESPATFVTWLKNGMFNNPLSAAGGILFSVVFVALLVLILKRSLPGRRTPTEESAESKEDKTRLLKPSARGSDEE